MPDPRGPKYVDHPAPSGPTAFVIFFLLFLVAAGIPVLLTSVKDGSWGAFLAILLLTIAITFFFLWQIYTTYYTLSPEGIHIRYGPWERLYPWSDFKAAFWRKGMFASRIGWPSVTPCVRFTNCVQLARKKGWFPLYLTPNDPRAFLARLSEFAPELTKETIL
jgi:hypothetical protein